MEQRRLSPGRAERGSAAEGAASGGRGRLAESWRRLSSRRGSKRTGASSPALPVSDRARAAPSGHLLAPGAGAGVVSSSLLRFGKRNRLSRALSLTL
ncbi:unnamed protein product [Coccothraustes coccothraustes]